MRKMSRKRQESTDLEERCLAIMSKSVDSAAEVAYHMNKRFERGYTESAYVKKMQRLEEMGRKDFQWSWQGYSHRPRSDHEDLEFLRETFNVDFIAQEGCLWEHGEVDCMVRSYHEGLKTKEIKQRLEDSFGRRRCTNQPFMARMFSAWSRPGNPCYYIWLRYTVHHKPDDFAGDKQGIDIPLQTATVSPDDTEGKLEGISFSSTKVMAWQAEERLKILFGERDSDDGTSLFDPISSTAASVIQGIRTSRTGNAEGVKTENPDFNNQPSPPISFSPHENVGHFDRLLPYLPGHLIPHSAFQAIAEQTQSMFNNPTHPNEENEALNSSLVTPTIERVPNHGPADDDLPPLSPIPIIPQAVLDLFDQFIEHLYSSRPRFELPHWSETEAALNTTNLGT